MDILYIGKCRSEIQERNVFRYGVPAYSSQFRALFVPTKDVNSVKLRTPAINKSITDHL
jgi:hypothetical protein